MITRLVAPLKPASRTTFTLLGKAFPGTVQLGKVCAGAAAGDLARRGIAGGAVFDALVGAAALEAGLPLISRDRRAQKTYVLLGVTGEFIEL